MRSPVSVPLVVLVFWLGNTLAPARAESPPAPPTSTPTSTPTSAAMPRDRWEETFRQRLNWWSLRPLGNPVPPRPDGPAWARNEVDFFLLAALRTKGLEPAPEAERAVLARRLSFALTGLPPTPEQVERFLADTHPQAYEHYVQEQLASPHFGERWARHWLDVVHYADTHGYEWDTPAKHAWRYRDYLVRAFNQDLPFQRLVLEQIAGDLIEPRMDPVSGLNESLIGPMALRLGERRHGDNAADEGVTQEAVANIIDTVTKGFLATTVACAQCHDHKLDAVEQRDYYGLAGLFMNTRWSVRSLDAVDPNPPILEELRRLKREIRSELGQLWMAASNEVATGLRNLPTPTSPAHPGIPETLQAWWFTSLTNAPGAEDFTRERSRRIEVNRTNLVLVADFTREEAAANGWRWEGSGMRHGLVHDGEPVIADSGNKALVHLLPAGRWSHVWSPHLAGAVRSPLLDCRPPTFLSAHLAAGGFAGEAFILDHAFHSERMQFVNRPFPGWRTLKAGDFDTLEGGIDPLPRRVYLEWATKSLNNYFPPRTGYGGVKESDLAEESSWFGVSRIYRHAAGQPPLDELDRFLPLFASSGPTSATVPGSDMASRLTALILAAVERWTHDRPEPDDVTLLNNALAADLLPNRPGTNSGLFRLVQQFRSTAHRLQPDRTIGSAAEWSEGRDERIGVRGSYTTFGDEVPRGNIRFLGGPQPRTDPATAGRLEFAQALADPSNPLTARVFVNRVWHYLFGVGLVRTPDDFGHLGEPPSHPELLDYLAVRFMAEQGSLKRLITLLVTSAAWRQDGRPTPRGLELDPENRLWHHRPMRRLEAEAIRDALLQVSGRLDPTFFGPPIDPPRTAEDPAKRLFRGPLDGQGRRSLYLKATLMEPPRFLALFNQPIPKLTTGRRDVTSVPDQALALLNDPFVRSLAAHWSRLVLPDGAPTPEHRARGMFARALGRPPTPQELERLVAFAQASAARHAATAPGLLQCEPAWQDVAHALFNLKEFIHVR